ncbi:MAG: glycosyltransferase family 4 protein [Bacteroidota bacterium]|nr:glycosyltransferase family 4 protein [Bacteroidota bacterium]MDP4229381.1 glycosyltransferase family 4 protein [Bacteroidota bacterium]MDP4235187.1 glycosyltransferase family 4 protein [Bacteroidota bacterium]
MTITFVGPAQSSFVKNDIAILEREHTIKLVDAKIGRGIGAAFDLLSVQFRILGSLFGSDILFMWFADYYTLIPTIIARLLRKKVYVVAGGFDVTYTPEVKSGARVKPLRWFLVRNTHRFATHVFPVSNYAQHLLDTNSKHHAPSTVIYNAVDIARFPFSDAPRQHRALTVTQLITELEYILKGMDVFLGAARIMPDVEFDLIGIRGPALEHARKEASDLKNVTILEGPVEYQTLLRYYQTASAYCQLSIDETFGVATAESMSCGCIPVVSDIPSLAEVTGGRKYIINRKDPQQIADAIRRSFDADLSERRECSDHVRKFDIENRAQKLLSLVR